MCEEKAESNYQNSWPNLEICYHFGKYYKYLKLTEAKHPAVDSNYFLGMMYIICLGFIGLLAMNCVEGLIPAKANCSTLFLIDKKMEQKCNCPAGEILANPYPSRPFEFYCFPKDSECPNGYFDRSSNQCRCFRYKDDSDVPSECEKLSDKCRDGCENGICIAPGRCSCAEGYALSKLNRCEPVCRDGCKNGFCMLPNWCSCKAGYVQVGINECFPLCRDGCENGICVAPGECLCIEGYSMSSESNKCKPSCPEGCQNGVCVGPRECICNPGYLMTQEFECVPICPGGCENGVCIAPGRCCCNKGYSLSNANKCEPVCPQGCRNGICTEPDRCSCNEGYSMSKSDKCEPVSSETLK